MAPKKAPEHPKYEEMIAAAIKSLKERNGSSVAAIRKYIGATYKLPEGWEKVLSVQLRRLSESGKLVKVKASYKLGEALKVAPKKPKKVVKKPKTEGEKKPKKVTKKKPTGEKKEKKEKPAGEKKKKPAAKKEKPVKEGKKPAAKKAKTAKPKADKPKKAAAKPKKAAAAKA